MARTFGLLELSSCLAVAVILSGCQFHAALGPYGDSAAETLYAQTASEVPRKSVTRVADRKQRSRRERTKIARSVRKLTPETKRKAVSPENTQLTIASMSGNSSSPNSESSRNVRHNSSGWRRTDTPTHNAVQRASAESPIAAGSLDAKEAFAEALPIPVPPAEAEGSGEPQPLAPEDAFTKKYPIDLVTALRLAGGKSWDVQLAVEKVRQAYTDLDAAKVLWLPSLLVGVGYTKHDGQIQDTRGDVIDVSRNALFVGGGAQAGSAPLAGASGGPARLFVDLSLADAIFEPLVAKQKAHAENHRHSAVYNDTLQSASLAYFELVRAQGKLAAAERDLANAKELVDSTEAFVLSGKGSRADTARARTEESTRRQRQVESRLAMKVASAELARILRLDPDTTLFTIEQRLAPFQFIDPSLSLSDHVEMGLSQRPEISEAHFRLDASNERVRAEQLRPFLPHLTVGASAGGFGGGRGNRLNDLNGRSDFDLLAIWRVKNLGFGTQADIEKSESQYWFAHHQLQKLRDSVASEITQAYHAVEAKREQIKLAELNVKEAAESLKQNKTRIRGLQGLPLETLQSVQAIAQANANLVDAIVDFNQAQARMLRATGRSPVDEEASIEEE